MDLLILLLLILLNGLFAMSEMAVVSSRKVRLEQSAKRGHRGAAAALALINEPTRFLSTVQIGITLIGIFAGAFGEAALSRDLAAWLEGFPLVSPYAGLVATVLVVLGITYLSLVLGELVPKRLALNNAERTAAAVAIPMRWVSRLGAPFVWLLTHSTDLLLKILGSKRPQSATVTEEEIKILVEEAVAGGALLEAEHQLVDSVFRLGDLRVRALMVPRGDVEWLPADATPERIREAVANSHHSHFPVCRDGLDDIVGVVHIKDILKQGFAGGQGGGRAGGRPSLAKVARPPLFVPESARALSLLETFRKSHLHIALVVDEHGVFQGLITLNDLVEAIIGHIGPPAPGEALEVHRADGSWLLDGSLPIARLKEILGVESLPKQDQGGFDTLSGYIMAYLGHIPRTGEALGWEGVRLEVVDMDGHRIDKVLLTTAPPNPPGAPRSPEPGA